MFVILSCLLALIDEASLGPQVFTPLCDAKLGCIFWQHTSPSEPVPPQIFLAHQWSLCQMCDGHGLCPVQIQPEHVQADEEKNLNRRASVSRAPPPVVTALDAADDEHIREMHSAIDSCGCIVMR
jgi:hypothetical protein